MSKNIFLFSILSVASLSSHAGFILRGTADINIRVPILVEGGQLTVVGNPEAAAVFVQDNTLGPNDLVIEANGTVNIDHAHIVVIGGNMTIQGNQVINNGVIYLNAGNLTVNAAQLIQNGGNIDVPAGTAALNVPNGALVNAPDGGTIPGITVRGRPIREVFPPALPAPAVATPSRVSSACAAAMSTVD